MGDFLLCIEAFVRFSFAMTSSPPIHSAHLILTAAGAPTIEIIAAVGNGMLDIAPDADVGDANVLILAFTAELWADIIGIGAGLSFVDKSAWDLRTDVARATLPTRSRSEAGDVNDTVDMAD